MLQYWQEIKKCLKNIGQFCLNYFQTVWVKIDSPWFSQYLVWQVTQGYLRDIPKQYNAGKRDKYEVLFCFEVFAIELST